MKTMLCFFMFCLQAQALEAKAFHAWSRSVTPDSVFQVCGVGDARLVDLVQDASIFQAVFDVETAASPQRLVMKFHTIEFPYYSGLAPALVVRTGTYYQFEGSLDNYPVELKRLDSNGLLISSATGDLELRSSACRR